jgi:hypothetical protein
VFVELDADRAGAPDELAVAFHAEESLADIWLFDLPDFTSEGARREGDVSLSLLPWFDRLVVLVDHERWFDRQAISQLRGESVRYAQQRFVLFNRTCEGELSESDCRALQEQAGRVEAVGTDVLEFRRGRGLIQFPPGTLDPVRAFLAGPPPSRRPALMRRLADAAGVVLNQNAERAARLRDLCSAVERTVERTVPDARSCLLGLMVAAERRQVAPVARILRLRDTRAWLNEQAGKLVAAVERVPVLGAAFSGIGNGPGHTVSQKTNRTELALAYAESVLRRQVHETNRTVQGCAFWDEIRRWVKLDPVSLRFEWDPGMRDEIERLAVEFDKAVAAWLARVETECRGLSPHVRGAVGVGGLALAIALIAAPGPVAALTFVTAKTAIGAALAEMLTAAGAGALLAKPVVRALAVVQENLAGTPEHKAVTLTATRMRDLLRAHAERMHEAVVAEARALVLDEDHGLHKALQHVQRLAEQSR